MHWSFQWTALTEGCLDAAGPGRGCNGSRFAVDAETPRPLTGLRGLPNLSTNRHGAIRRSAGRLPLARLRALKGIQRARDNKQPHENLRDNRSRTAHHAMQLHDKQRHQHHHIMPSDIHTTSEDKN